MTFLEWLDAELERREWSEGKLAQRAHISRSLISHVRHGRRPASADFCIAVANGFDADPVAVLRLETPLTNGSKQPGPLCSRSHPSTGTPRSRCCRR